MKFPFETVALIGKYKSPEIAAPLLRLGEFLSGRGLDVVVDTLTAEILGEHPFRVCKLEDMSCAPLDLVIVLGGDGTMLNIARMLAPCQVPLVGVNQGRLGFLTDISLNTVRQTLASVLDGEYVTEERLLLSSTVRRNGEEQFHSLAFNEVVVHRGNISTMIEFEVRIDGEYLYTQRADGLIVTSPTGSTAYALSAGGAIVHPGLDVIQLVPVCPHTLSNRPIVVRSESRVEIVMHRPGGVRARFDSHSDCDLAPGSVLEVTRHPTPVRLLHPIGHSYYRTLREKLLWNQSP